jgi:Zn-dependent peptidase ImmA (M78 family)
MTPHIRNLSTIALARIKRPNKIYKSPTRRQNSPADRIMRTLCHKMGISMDVILYGGSKYEDVMPRFIIAHHLREGKMKLTDIAKAMNKANHSVISHYLKQYDNLVSTKNTEFARLLDKLQ